MPIHVGGRRLLVAEVMDRGHASRDAGEGTVRPVAEDPVEKVADAALPGAIHPGRILAPRVSGIGRFHTVWQAGVGQATRGGIADLADLGVGAGVVVTGADEPAALLVVERDVVADAGQPRENAAGHADLVAVVGRDAVRGG